MDQVEQHLKRMKIVGWRAKVEDRQEWNRIVEQTKTHPGGGGEREGRRGGGGGVGEEQQQHISEHSKSMLFHQRDRLSHQQ